MHLSTYSVFVVVLLVALSGSLAQDEYVDCIPGDINVIIAAPHGGDLQPSSIPDRDAGCYIDGECVWSHDCGSKDFDNCRAVPLKDNYTQELTRAMRVDLHTLFGGYPHLVINLLHRRKFDANRDLGEATFGVPEVEDAWEEWHDCIDTAKAEIEADETWNGMGLFFDNHGHPFDEDWTQLGYVISGESLNDNNYDPDDTSIQALGYYVAAEEDTDFDDLLRGDLSYGHFLEEEGYEAVPSALNPGPGDLPYFSGGYNTERHGSRHGGSVDGIQIESAMVDREDYPVYAGHLSNAIHRFMLAHYPGTPSGAAELLISANTH